MITKFLKLLMVPALLLIMWLAPIPSHSVHAAYDPLGNTCTGEAANSPVCSDPRNKGDNNPVAGKNGVLSVTSNIIAIITGIAAVIVIIASGFTFATSGNNPEKAKAARQSLIGALVGLAVIVLAWTLVSFINGRIIHS